MCFAAQAAGVGPMAAVAGAFAAHVGHVLLKDAQQVIVENGGDIFLKTESVKTIAVYAGKSPFELKSRHSGRYARSAARCVHIGRNGRAFFELWQGGRCGGGFEGCVLRTRVPHGWATR